MTTNITVTSPPPPDPDDHLPRPCPTCGHCPTCGRGGPHVLPQPIVIQPAPTAPWPQPWPGYPWTWISTCGSGNLDFTQ